jgi:hypothetical protein
MEGSLLRGSSEGKTFLSLGQDEWGRGGGKTKKTKKKERGQERVSSGQVRMLTGAPS